MVRDAGHSGLAHALSGQDRRVRTPDIPPPRARWCRPSKRSRSATRCSAAAGRGGRPRPAAHPPAGALRVIERLLPSTVRVVASARSCPTSSLTPSGRRSRACRRDPPAGADRARVRPPGAGTTRASVPSRSRRGNAGEPLWPVGASGASPLPWLPSVRRGPGRRRPVGRHRRRGSPAAARRGAGADRLRARARDGRCRPWHTTSTSTGCCSSAQGVGLQGLVSDHPALAGLRGRRADDRCGAGTFGARLLVSGPITELTGRWSSRTAWWRRRSFLSPASD